MSKSAVLMKRNPTFGGCPSCKELNTLKKSHSRNTKEKIINGIGVYHTYRCTKCGWRGYLTSVALTLHSIKKLLIYISILIITVFVTYQILKRIF
jgi:phage FluMu protein Com